MKTSNAQRIVQHLAQPTKLINFVLYGYLSVTVALKPDCQRYAVSPRQAGANLFYTISVVIGSDKRECSIAKTYTVYDPLDEGEKNMLALRYARHAAQKYLSDGFGVRSRGGMVGLGALDRHINRKQRIDRITPNPSGKRQALFFHDALAERKQSLKVIQHQGVIGKPEAVGAMWLR